MTIAKSIFKSIFKGYGRGFAGGETTGPDQANLLAWYRTTIADGKLIAYAPPSSHTTQQVKSSGFAGIGSGTLTGLLTTDDLTSSGPDTPTCTVDGTVIFGADCWDIFWHRDGVLMGYYPGINVGQTTELDASNNDHHLTNLITTVITERLDGTGTNYHNLAGRVHVDTPLQYILGDGTGYLSSAAIVGTETVISKNGTAIVTIAAGKVNVGVGTLWSFVLSNGSTYEFATLTGASTAVCFDTSGNGRNLVLVGFSDVTAACATGLVEGSDYLNQDGWTQILDQSFAHPYGADLASKRMVTVVVGNSIAAAGKYLVADNKWNFIGSEIQLANMLSGTAMEFELYTPTTRMDKYGTYGYSGSMLAGINADLATQFYTPIGDSGVVPDLIIGQALLENDIVSGRTYEQCVGDLTTWINTAQSAYPNAKILLCTPHPSFSYNTEGKKAVYQQLVLYYLSLDNGLDVFVTECNGYENPLDVGTPLTGYTDSSTHPNSRGSLVNARSIAETLKRVNDLWLIENRSVSNNYMLAGVNTATGTYVSGTKANLFSPADNSNANRIVTARNPYQDIEYTVAPSATRKDIAADSCGAIALASPTAIYPFVTIEIVSGAENLSFAMLEPRIVDGAGNTFQYYMFKESGDSNEADWANGDILTIRRPRTMAIAGSMTQVINYLRVQLKPSGGSVVIRILNQGCEVVA